MNVLVAKEMLAKAIAYMVVLAADDRQRRILAMHTDYRYTQKKMAPYVGYDQWAAWLIIVEWFWMVTLAILGIIPQRDAELLTTERLLKLLKYITTTKQDRREYGRDGKKGTNHDILALLELMRRYLPRQLWRWLHYTGTSYDTISTAYALQLHILFDLVLWPTMQELDVVWRKKIEQYLETRQVFRTHLQPAIPGTVGCYLSCLHRQFVDSAYELSRAAHAVPGKFCGFVGTAASQRAVGIPPKAERMLMEILNLPKAKGSTQIPPAHHIVRFYSELVATAGPLMSFADDLRILHMPELDEIIPSEETSSTSSAGAAKEANPIRAEQVDGMDVLILTSALRTWLTRGSNFQRDLRWSSVMRTYVEAIEYFGQMLYSLDKQMRVLAFNKERCLHWVEVFGPASMAELLHNVLQREGFVGAHGFVKKELIMRIKAGAPNLCVAARQYVESPGADPKFERAWRGLTARERRLLIHPENYLGDAVRIARVETQNALI